MKKINKSLLIILLMISTTISFSQVIVTSEGMVDNNGNSIPECGTIDLGSNSEITLSLWVRLTKQSNQVVGDGYLYIYTKYDVNAATENLVFSKQILSSYWTNNNTLYLDYFTTDPIQAQIFNTTGGVLFIRYVSSSNSKYESCNYSIIKDEVPTFTISPTSTIVSCDSNASKTFTVTNVYNSPGSLSYHWSVGNGWSYNGNPISNFTTTSNSVTLVPTTYPLSDVQVIPKLDGVSYPQLTSTVSLGSYNPSVSISGVSQICSTGILSVNNLPTGSTVTSWHSPNTSIATISSINNHQGLITKVNDGIVYISAIVENSCGQQKTIYKSITVGSPNNLDTIDQFFLIEGMNDVVVETVDGIYDLEWKVNGVLVNDNGNDWVHIYFSNYPCVNNQVVLSARVDGVCGWSNWLDMTYGECGFGGGMFRFSSNPMKKGNGQIFILEKNLKKSPKNYTISIYNNYGKQVYTRTQQSILFDINTLNKGLYFVKYESSTGKVETKRLIIN